MGAFTYHRTLQGKRIRLIKISPDARQSILSIKLLEYNLDGSAFEALSYVWGDQTDKVQIRCDGRSMEIGANLHAALLERRHRRSTILLWADQICINQNDSEEKTCQVRLMSEIYAQSSRVIIWLGKQQPDDLKGLNLANTLYQKCDGSQYDADVGRYDSHDFDCRSSGVPDPKFNSEWNALFGIISNPWFSRVWVVQELLVAQDSIMWKGSLDLNTDVVLWAAMQIARHRNLCERYDISMGSPKASALMARNIAEGYCDFRKKGPLPIYDTLSRYSGMGATDRRDRFFALIGVSSGISEAFVSYKKTFTELACIVGKMTLLGIPNYQVTENGTEVLVLEKNPKKHRFLIEWLAFHANPRNNTLGIPSWIPDLVSPHSPGLPMTGFYNSLYLQQKRTVPAPEVRMKEEFSERSILSTSHWEISVPNEIEIKGAIFDQVRVIARGRPKLPSSAVSKYETKMVHWLSEIRLLADPSLDPRGSIMDGQSFDAFWRTLLYNRGPRFNYKSPNQPAENELGVSFGYWYLVKKLQMAKRWQYDIEGWAFHTKILKELAAPFEQAEGRVGHARHFFVSQHGRIGWVPFRTQIGDQVCVFKGMRMPLVVRPRHDQWEIIGACYLHGLMDGELWDSEGLL